MIRFFTITTSTIRITRPEAHCFEKMEKRFSIWIADEIERNMLSNRAIIMKKLTTIFNHVQNKKNDTSENFVASRGWFHLFKNLHNIPITGEAAS